MPSHCHHRRPAINVNITSSSNTTTIPTTTIIIMIIIIIIIIIIVMASIPPPQAASSSTTAAAAATTTAATAATAAETAFRQHNHYSSVGDTVMTCRLTGVRTLEGSGKPSHIAQIAQPDVRTTSHDRACPASVSPAVARLAELSSKPLTESIHLDQTQGYQSFRSCRRSCRHACVCP